MVTWRKRIKVSCRAKSGTQQFGTKLLSSVEGRNGSSVHARYQMSEEEVQNAQRGDPVLVVQIPQAVQYRIVAERDMTQKEMEAHIAKLDAELKAAVAGRNTNSISGRYAGREEGKAEACEEELVSMETTAEMYRNALRKKKKQ